MAKGIPSLRILYMEPPRGERDHGNHKLPGMLVKSRLVWYSMAKGTRKGRKASQANNFLIPNADQLVVVSGGKECISFQYIEVRIYGLG